jgi:putative acetyltransferase
MIIRREIAEDALTIRAVTAAAFKDAPHSSGAEAAIVDTLRDAGALALSLVAETQGRIVGHVALWPVAINGAVGPWFGLGRLRRSDAESAKLSSETG